MTKIRFKFILFQKKNKTHHNKKILLKIIVSLCKTTNKIENVCAYFSSEHDKNQFFYLVIGVILT